MMNKFAVSAAATILTSVSGSVWAWEVKVYYPSAISPALPSPEEAVQLRAQQPFLLRPFRHAYREANLHGWIGMPSVEQSSVDR